VLPGATATFSASANGNPTTVTWQVSSNNGTSWSNVTATSTTTTNGVTTTTLSLTQTTVLANNGQLYRAVFTNATGSVTTNQALLSVSAATITGVGVQWGTKGSAALVTNADGLRLLPAGRTNDIPWLNINRITITLDKAVSTLAVGDVKLASAVAGTAYTVTSVTSVTGSGGTTWTITFANNLNSTVGTGIINADRVTVTIGNGQLTSYARRLDVLPGDVNDDLAVNTLDTAAVKNYYTSLTIAYVALLDVDGNGVVDVTDYNLVLGRVGKKLP